MKQLFSISTVVLIIFLVGLQKTTNPLYVTGKLVRYPGDKKQRVFQIIVKGDTKIVAKAKTKKTGEFELSFTPLGEKYFDFFYIDPRAGADTMFLKSYTTFESDELEVTFYMSKVVVRKDGEPVCPKCGKSDSLTLFPEYMHPGYNYCLRDRIKFGP